MLNLAEKFTPEAVEATEDDGLVAIEYVLMAGVIVVALGGLAWSGAFGALTTKITQLINSIDVPA
jgi:hypothetical protein